MALIHHQSCDGLDTGLDLFSVPPTQTALEDGQFVEFHPLASLSPGAPVEFSISGASGEYLDLHHTFLHVQAKVTKPDGTDLDADMDVAPVNNWLHSLFSQVDVSLNDTLITPSENTYPYRAYLESTLSYGEEAKSSQLTNALYYADTPGHVTDTQNNDNVGLQSRRNLAARSRVIDMMGRLHVDIFHQERYLISGVDVKVRLVPTKDVFNLIAHNADGGFRSRIVHASLFVRKIKLNPAVMLAHEKALEKGTAKYPIKRVVMKTFAISTGSVAHVQDNLFLSQTPVRLVIGYVDSRDFNGRLNSNPFNFEHKNLNFLCIYHDGKQIPAKALTPDFERGQYARCYHGLFEGLGLVNKDLGNGVTYTDYSQGYTLYAFDLSPSLLDGSQFELIKSGGLRLEMKFAQALTQPLQVLVYAELDSVLEIDRSRQVLTDYTV